MMTELFVKGSHLGGMEMAATNGTYTVTTDYPLNAGENAAALTPLELLLVSLTACSGSVLALLLARADQGVIGVEVEARGRRRLEHPSVLTRIDLRFIVAGSHVEPEAVRAAIARSEQICPVWAMLRVGTPIVTSFETVEAAGGLTGGAGGVDGGPDEDHCG
jgi:uncharacterized OsmC-like protein